MLQMFNLMYSILISFHNIIYWLLEVPLEELEDIFIKSNFNVLRSTWMYLGFRLFQCLIPKTRLRDKKKIILSYVNDSFYQKHFMNSFNKTFKIYLERLNRDFMKNHTQVGCVENMSKNMNELWFKNVVFRLN